MQFLISMILIFKFWSDFCPKIDCPFILLDENEDGHYLDKFFLVCEISLILYHTLLMTRRLQFDIYPLLEVFLSEQKIDLY